MPAALQSQQVLYTVGDPRATERSEARRVVNLAEDFFHSSRRESRRFRYFAIVVLYPPETSQEFVNEIQYQSKVGAVRQGAMVGALHPHNNAESIYGGGYYPLRTPTPTIVLRDMVPSDLQFLDQRRFSAKKRLSFLRQYLDTFGDSQLEWERQELKRAQAEMNAGLRELERTTVRSRAVLAGIAAVGLAILILSRASLG